jgi:hypothetical protein
VDDQETKALSMLARARQGKRHTEFGKLPGCGTQFVWRVLTGDERQECVGAALKRFKDLGIPYELRLGEELVHETWYQILHLAMRDPDLVDKRSFAYSVDEFRKLIGDDERDILATQYMDIEEKVNPQIDQITEDEYNAILRVIKKNDMPAGINYGSAALWNCLRIMATQLQTLPSFNSGSGASSEQTTTSQSEPQQQEPQPPDDTQDR